MEDQEFKAFKEEENSARVYERLLFSYCVCDKRINSCVGTSFFEKKFKLNRRFFPKNEEQEEFPSLTGKTSSSSDEQPSSRVERIIIIIITFSSSSVFLFAQQQQQEE